MRARGDRDVIILEPEGSSPVGWFVLGAALGAGLALLLAPASGADTRRKLGRQARRLQESAEDTLDDLKERFDSFRETVDDTVEDVKSEVVHASRSLADTVAGEDEATPIAKRPRRSASASAREELERRLAEARARRSEPLAEEEEPVA
jgi:gas vesicle protein